MVFCIVDHTLLVKYFAYLLVLLFLVKCALWVRSTSSIVTNLDICRPPQPNIKFRLVIEGGIDGWEARWRVVNAVNYTGEVYFHSWEWLSPPKDFPYVFKLDQWRGYTQANLDGVEQKAREFPGYTWILGEEPNGNGWSAEEFSVWYNDFSQAILRGSQDSVIVFGYLAQRWNGHVATAPMDFVDGFYAAWARHTDWCPKPVIDLVHFNFFPEIVSRERAIDVALVLNQANEWKALTDSRGVGLSLGVGIACQPAEQWIVDLVPRVRRFVNILMNFPGYYRGNSPCSPTAWATSVVDAGANITPYGFALRRALAITPMWYLPMVGGGTQ